MFALRILIRENSFYPINLNIKKIRHMHGSVNVTSISGKIDGLHTKVYIGTDANGQVFSLLFPRYHKYKMN